MSFRTNQPESAFASLSAFWEQSMQQNKAMDLRRIPLWSITLSIFVLAFQLSPFLFQSKEFMQIALVAPASSFIRWRQPPLHTYNIEELLQHLHYNQKNAQQCDSIVEAWNLAWILTLVSFTSGLGRTSSWSPWEYQLSWLPKMILLRYIL